MRGPLLQKRLEWERANPRHEGLVRAERGIVRALVDEGFENQRQITACDWFEIRVEDIVIRVEAPHV